MSPEVLAWTTFGLALFGAGAWIPTIWQWLQKPDVQIVSGEVLEVSYMEFGGVLNIACAFVSLGKAALIEDLSLQLEHEDGSRLQFFCVGLIDTTSAQSSSGERVSWDRQSRVHTIALGKDSSLERMVWFRDRALAAPLRALYERVVPLSERLRETEGDGWRDAMRRSQEFDEYRRTVRDGQPWRRGTYSAVLQIKVRQLGELVQHRFSFSLSDADIRAISSNLRPIDEFIAGVLTQAEPPVRRPGFSFALPARVP